MTTVAGMYKGGRAFLASDSAWSAEGVQVSARTPKVWRSGEMLVGCAGDGRSAWLLRQVLKPMPAGAGGEWLEQQVARLAPLFKERDVKPPTALCCWRGGIAEVDDFFVLEYDQPFASIGTGSNFALGVLAAGRRGNPEALVRRAVEVAIQFDPSSAGRVQVAALG